MKYALAALALAFGAQALAPAPAQETPQTPKRRPGVASVVYVLAVDPARAKAAGWTSADASDAQVVESAAAVVRRRLEAMERAFRIETKPETLGLELSMPQVEPRERELFAQLFTDLGLFEFLYHADDPLLVGLELDPAREREKLDAWRLANPALPLAAFDALDASVGPHRRLLWIESSFPSHTGAVPVAVLLPDRPEDCAGAASCSRVYAASEAYGHPAIGLEFSAGRSDDIARVTEAHVERRLGVVFEGRLRASPTLASKLDGKALIEGRFTEAELTHLVQTMTKLEGPLKVLEIR